MEEIDTYNGPLHFVPTIDQVFISYRQESLEHARAVRCLGELLRQAKIPVVLDQFFLDENPGGPNVGWPKWCEDCAIQSRCVLIIASAGWFAAYDNTEPPGVGMGAASEADILRQTLYDEKGNNARFRIALLHNVGADKFPVRLRAWSCFRPFDSDEQLDLLIRWLGDNLGLQSVESPTVRWPGPVVFQPDIANRNTKEWPAIVDLLSGHVRERVLLFEGPSGIGKSEIIGQAVSYAKKLGIVVATIILKGGILTTEDVMGRLDLELSGSLPTFSQDGACRTHLLRKDLRALRRPVLLVFDNYEAIADNKTITDWLGQQLLIEVETALGLAVIIAGQRVPDLACVRWRHLARHILLGPIKEIEPWQNWILQHYPDFESKGDLLTVLKLAQGNPLIVASFCAALAKG